ncbi:uncharacterized protein LOC126662423 [Mercurialis annua]|uniref:uncharacterized protein LOC126662423 n=1 Tax=Mercurialis annua TaxID=3986 RepID=UPI00215F9922|nr:uncharacterized protein LOC126662423 [Mercurialis annua]
MSSLKKGKKKRPVAIEAATISWQEKKDVADKEEVALNKEIQDLIQWTEMIEGMDDEQLKEYVKNRPDQLKTVKMQKSKPRQRVQQVRKDKGSTSNGIMASVWKFHKEDNGNCSLTFGS